MFGAISSMEIIKDTRLRRKKGSNQSYFQEYENIKNDFNRFVNSFVTFRFAIYNMLSFSTKV